MGFGTRTLSFDLSPTGIDKASEWLTQNQTEIGVSKDNRVRARLLFEEALLNFSDHFGQEKQVDAYLEKHLGRCRLRVVVKGDKYNPTKNDETDLDELSASLFTLVEMRAQYAYTMGANVVRILSPLPTMNPVLRIIVAIVVGLAAGLLGDALFPDSALTLVTDAVLDPLANMWMRLLQAISGPIIFFTAFTAALNTKGISDFGGSRITAVARYFGIGAIVVVLSMLCSYWLFQVNITIKSPDRQDASALFEGITSIVPNNLIEPFFTADTPQLLLIALVTGYVLGSMGNQVSELKTLIRQVNRLGVTVARQACALVPYFVGLLVCLKIWSQETGMLAWIWVPLIASTVLAILMFFATVMFVSVRVHVVPVVLLRKLWDPFFEALKSGSVDYASVTKLATHCKQSLGIDSSFAHAMLPQGLVLYMPTSAIGIMVFVLFAAQQHQVAADHMWLLTAAALSTVLAVATPPLNGANLLAFVVAFAYLGIPLDVFLDVMVFDIIFGVLCIATDQAMLQLDTILQAERMGFLDKEVLRAPES